MVNKIGALSAGFVICGSLLLVVGIAVVALIAYDPILPTFGGGGGVPTYYYFESISGGTPLVSLGITMTAAGLVTAFHNRHQVTKCP